MVPCAPYATVRHDAQEFVAAWPLIGLGPESFGKSGHDRVRRVTQPRLVPGRKVSRLVSTAITAFRDRRRSFRATLARNTVPADRSRPDSPF